MNGPRQAAKANVAFKGTTTDNLLPFVRFTVHSSYRGLRAIRVNLSDQQQQYQQY
jgi:hypothetical protein